LVGTHLEASMSAARHPPLPSQIGGALSRELLSIGGVLAPLVLAISLFTFGRVFALGVYLVAGLFGLLIWSRRAGNRSLLNLAGIFVSATTLAAGLVLLAFFIALTGWAALWFSGSG
jgi:hypothetical protein